MRNSTWVLALFVVLMGCAKKEPEAPAVPVKASAVTMQDVREAWLYSGAVQPKVEVKMAFKQPGYVASLYQVRGTDGTSRDVQPGDRVPAGTSLARLRSGDFEASLDSAAGQAKSMQGQLQAAKSDLEAAQADQKRADLDFERAEGLYAAKAMTRPDYDAAVAQHKDAAAKTESAIRQIEARQGQLQAAQAQIHSAKISLGEASLTTAMPAVVVSKDVEVGTLVSAGTAGFTIADTRTVDIEFGVPDSMLPQFKMGMPVPVTVEGLQERQFTGHVTQIAASANSDSRVFNIKVSLQNQDGALKVGMIASVKIEQATGSRKLPVLPVAALITTQSGSNEYSVFVVTEENGKQIAHLRSVRTGQIVDRSVVIEDGLFQGDRVVMERTNQLADGALVRVIN